MPRDQSLYAAYLVLVSANFGEHNSLLHTPLHGVRGMTIPIPTPAATLLPATRASTTTRSSVTACSATNIPTIEASHIPFRLPLESSAPSTVLPYCVYAATFNSRTSPAVLWHIGASSPRPSLFLTAATWLSNTLRNKQ
ncbi:hypothetical protein K469DRAFT_700187 [Zopfia rhizophila CBS 207.26]|uniref:Uncharacterized protein n=1 Tax=Zopfia rhizophila CBS 207.26 TaxID=1314779 RepID=A0A6A6DFB9_9PEZI|nr:hypothetical protein K469DRAFT_700187 [Zopfia rhizophila CBS 207.26]